jgi:hypothetical protein
LSHDHPTYGPRERRSNGALTLAFHSLNLEDRGVEARFGGMYRSFFGALQAIGVSVAYITAEQRVGGDVAVLPMGGGQEYRGLRAIQDFLGPLVLYVPPASAWFDAAILSRLRHRVLFAYGTDASSASPAAYKAIGMDYVCLPFGSDPLVMKPLDLPPSYDVAFVGSAGHAPRRAEFIDPLLRAFPRDRILVVGSGWERFGISDQQLEWGPLLNILYNLATVCVNIHGAEQVRGRDRQLDANNRLFDLAMAGRCQVSDNPALVGDYFSPDEVATADEPQAWVQKVRELVADPRAANEYGARARSRALERHTWDARAGEFCAHLRRGLADWPAAEPHRLTIGPVLSARMLADGFHRRARRFRRGFGR